MNNGTLNIKRQTVIKEIISPMKLRYLHSISKYNPNKDLVDEKEYYPNGRLSSHYYLENSGTFDLMAYYDINGRLLFRELKQNKFDKERQIIEQRSYDSYGGSSVEINTYNTNGLLSEKQFDLYGYRHQTFFEYDKNGLQRRISHFTDGRLIKVTKIERKDNVCISTDYDENYRAYGSTHIYNNKAGNIKKMTCYDLSNQPTSKSEYFYDSLDRNSDDLYYNCKDELIEVVNTKYIDDSRLISKEETITVMEDNDIMISVLNYDYEFYSN